MQKSKRAKYFSELLDCTPDISHKKQISLIPLFVNMTSLEANVEEYFMDFIPVNDQTGKGLSNVLLTFELEILGLNINDVRAKDIITGRI